MEPIAIIGLGCRFPSAPDVDSLWELICSGRDVLRPAPEGRYLDLAEPGFARSELGVKLSGLRGGFLDGIDLFDPAAFHISPREARVVDPQQRLLLETAWEALEDAGQDMRRLAGGPVGVYVGVWGSDYQARLFRAAPRIDIAMTAGGGRYAAAGRLSYAFDFRGPSMTVDTACSSSLVSIHMACQALRAGECALAVAGGVNVILDSAVTIAYLAAGALSPDGRCKFGDASADGYARSEGAGMVVLKTLRAALADGDPVHAIIRGSAVSHNGQTGGSLLAPGEEGQVQLIKHALASAGVGPADLDYIEAHGTGTKVGDRMELRALGALLREGRRADAEPCLVGSIKTNIGHTESAAGVAGLIKAILCLKHREVPPSLNFLHPNPDVPWDELPLRIVRERTPLRSGGGPARAGVNSFGITGAFAHVILEEAPGCARAVRAPAAGAPLLLPLSAHGGTALAGLAGAYARQIRAAPGAIENVAYSAALRRTHHEARLALAGRDAHAMADGLEAFARGEPAPGLCTPPEASHGEPRVGWIFSGQGPQWAGMGRQLLETEPAFRAAIERLEGLIQAQTGWSLIRELTATGEASKLNVTAIAQPAIFSIQIGLAELFASWGLKPAMILGHSVGEAAAACVAGLLTLPDAVRLICARARIAEQASGLGRMAAVEMTVEEARQLIAELGGALSLAAVNAPRSLTISGALPLLEKFCERLAALGRFWRIMDVNYPFHSALLDPLLPAMAAASEGIAAAAPHTPLYSSVHGRLAGEHDFAPAYWPRNLRDTVLFGPAVEQMAAAGCNVFVEMSPHPVLGYSIKQVLQAMGKPGSVVETLHRAGDEPVDVRKAVGELYALGCDPDWKALVPPGGEPVRLPAYCWQRESYWIDERPGTAATGPLLDPLLQKHLRAMGDAGADYWVAEIGLRAFPWLAEHCVQRRAVFPAAAYLLPALKAAGQLMPGAALADVELHEALFIPAEGTVSMQFRYQRAEDGTVSMAIHAGNPDRPELARKHLSGRVRLPDAMPEPARLDPALFSENGIAPSGREAVYAGMRRCRLDYGEAFQGITGIRHGHGEALARLTLPPSIEAESDGCGIHPATFDACLQALVALTPGWPDSGDPWMPRGVREVTLRKLPSAGAQLLAWAGNLSLAPERGEMTGDIFLIEESGEVLLAARGVRLQKVSRERDSAEWLHEVRWTPQPLQPETQSGDANFMPPLAELERRMETAKPTPGEQASIRAAMAELDRIGGLSVQRALEELGLGFTPGRQFTTEEAFAESGILASHRRLFGRLLQILGEDEVLAREGDAWRVVRRPEGDLAEALRNARALENGFAPLLDIFKRASLNLAGVLAGRVNAVELLFGGEGAATLAALYATHPGWQAPMRQLAQAVAAIVERLPQGRKLRVLEIGAGTGGLTSHLLPLMPAGRTEYFFTDLSGFFLARAMEKFRAYPFLKEGTLDIERDPASQGFVAGSFDLVVAANCLHATRDLRKSLDHAGQLLAPGGWLLLQEETAAERWTDLIFGLTDGWWRFEDAGLRPDHALLAPGRWRETLREQGLADAAVMGGSAEDACGAAVVLARKPGTRRWTLLGDRGGVASQLGKRLEELGQSCEIIDPGTEQPAAADLPGRTLVDLRALDARLAEDDSATALSATEERALEGFLDVARRLADDVQPPRLALVTRGSQATGLEEGSLALAQALPWTVARVAALESSRAPITRIDLDASPIGSHGSQIAALAEELLHGDGETEVAFRHGNRMVRRLHRLTLPGAEPFAMNIVNRGSLDGVEAQPDTPKMPGPNEVQIRVAAAGMNFRDLLNVLGAVDAVPLGLECSGVVTAIGEGVRDFSIGDEVMAAGLGTWRTYFNVSSALVAAKPARLRHEQAAALPIAYLTAHYALRHVACIQRGQRVLIHSAAGGVGLAAVHLALAAGAAVYGTAGSPAKRDFLRGLGVQHVFDSRSLRFSEEIAAMGGGLDVVLNCFTGEFIPRSLDLLAEGGHFVEIGKRDIWSNGQMAERRPDVHYTVLELAETMRNAPESLGPMLRQLAAELAEGALPPLPIRAFPMSQAVLALSHMQQARHTGKIVLKAPRCDFSHGSWLITGGMGGMGLAVTEWLAERGARGILLIGRQEPRAEALAVIERCAARGCRVLARRCDVADEGALRSVLERAAGELGPLRGVFHMAGVLDDAPVRNLDWARLEKVYGPKVIGAWNLHRLTRDMPLEAFVLFSSWTALTGSPGQAAHASASAFLDALAHYRRGMGLPGQAINWGGWSEVGSAARPERLAHLARQGAGGLSTAEALDALGRVMGSDAIQVGVSPFDAAVWQASTGSEPAGRFVEELIEDEVKEEATKQEAELPLREALLKAVPGPARRQVMEGCIQRRLARVLRMPATKFDVRKPFKHLGLDSLGALEIRNVLEGDVARKLPASLIYNHATVASLATGLAAEMGIPLDEVDKGDLMEDADEVAALLGALQELPAEEALRLLGQEGAEP